MDGWDEMDEVDALHCIALSFAVLVFSRFWRRVDTYLLP
jgi:hypothetical protein